MLIRIAHDQIVGMSSYRKLQSLFENRVTNSHLFAFQRGDVQVVDMLRDSDSGVQAQTLLTLSKQGWKTNLEFGVTQLLFQVDRRARCQTLPSNCAETLSSSQGRHFPSVSENQNTILPWFVTIIPKPNQNQLQ